MKSFLRFLKEEKGFDFTPSQVVDYLEKEREGDSKSRTPERLWREFFSWMKPLDLARGTKRIKGVDVRSFLEYHDIRFRSGTKLPSWLRGDPRRDDAREQIIRIPEIKKLLVVQSGGDSLRFRAMLLCQLQAGFDVKTLRELKIGDVKSIDNAEPPFMIDLVRTKTNVKFRAFLGRDAMDAIMNYLKARRVGRYECAKCGTHGRVWRARCSNGHCNAPVISYYLPIDYDDPLFVTHGGGRGKDVEESYRTWLRMAAVQSGLMSEKEMEKCSRNPYAPHKIRAAFNEILRDARMPGEYREVLMAHGDKYRGAYNKFSAKKLKEIYIEFMGHLSVTEDPRLPGMEMDLEDALRRIDQLEKEKEFLEDDQIERILEELYKRRPDVKKFVEDE
ncbi:MAG: hypothetical protein KAR42_17330 [candidate division Zixibacteria bacterium]|nr:hypothetical protein [candidate division Zixibacteria bacterium]